MAQERRKPCKNCHRLIDIHVARCPFCSQETDFEKDNTQKSSVGTVSLEEFDEMTDISETASTATRNVDQTPQSAPKVIKPKQIKRSNIPEFEEFQNDDLIDEGAAGDANDENATTVAQDIIPEEDDEEEYKDFTRETYENETNPGSTNSKAIVWDDEKVEQKKMKENMYDEKGHYNANYDGYYDDIVPKIQDELEQIKAFREKTILKIIFSIVCIFGIIVYLILTI